MVVQELVPALVQIQVLPQVLCRDNITLNAGQEAGACSYPGAGPVLYLVQVLLQIQVRTKER